jgi:hypothetical protein
MINIPMVSPKLIRIESGVTNKDWAMRLIAAAIKLAESVLTRVGFSLRVKGIKR